MRLLVVDDEVRLVHTAAYVDAVKSAGGPLLDKKRIQLPGHIKTLGSHVITVDLHPDVVASIPVTVTALS